MKQKKRPTTSPAMPIQVGTAGLTPRRLGACMLALIIADALWLGCLSVVLGVYPPSRPGSLELLPTRSSLAAGMVAWTALAVAITAGQAECWCAAVQWGAAVGGITYAVFNGTEMAIRPDWGLGTAVVDVGWGICVGAWAAAWTAQAKTH